MISIYSKKKLLVETKAINRDKLIIHKYFHFIYHSFNSDHIIGKGAIFSKLFITGLSWLRFLFFILIVFISSCLDKNETGKIVINLNHKVNGYPLEVDTLKYINAAGNPYLISEIQYFISDVVLYKVGGYIIKIGDGDNIHYVDSDLPETWKWEVYDHIPAGHYDSISFVFGIPDEKNISFMYVNPPESYMFWPEYLGGGYHYMKLNGKWLEEGQTVQTTPFNCHLGRGQIYFSYPDSITGFIPNEFRVSLPGSSFVMADGGTNQINLTMNIENWFKEPHTYDFDEWGSYTMQNQEAMQTLKENGYNVFSVLIE
jgi:hypothetical protein